MCMLRPGPRCDDYTARALTQATLDLKSARHTLRDLPADTPQEDVEAVELRVAHAERDLRTAEADHHISSLNITALATAARRHLSTVDIDGTDEYLLNHAGELLSKIARINRAAEARRGQAKTAHALTLQNKARANMSGWDAVAITRTAEVLDELRADLANIERTIADAYATAESLRATAKNLPEGTPERAHANRAAIEAAAHTKHQQVQMVELREYLNNAAPAHAARRIGMTVEQARDAGMVYVPPDPDHLPYGGFIKSTYKPSCPEIGLAGASFAYETTMLKRAVDNKDADAVSHALAMLTEAQKLAASEQDTPEAAHRKHRDRLTALAAYRESTHDSQLHTTLDHAIGATRRALDSASRQLANA